MIEAGAREHILANAAAPPARIETAAGLILSTAITHESDVFARFFAGYDKAFVLPNEKEDEEGFARCFMLNVGGAYARLSALYGPYSEVCLIAEEDGAEIGGANFIAMPINADTISANLNYIYINESARGGGRFSKLVDGVRETLAALYPGRTRTLIFIEQNDPFAMSAADYLRDTEFTGLDQLDRLRIWAKRGARVVDFPYAQPPLSPEQGADDTLVYSVLGAEGDALGACVLEAHLRRFFGVSVLKGAALEANAAAFAQIEAMRGACAGGRTIGLCDPQPLLARLRRREDIAALWADPPASVRQALAAPLSA